MLLRRLTVPAALAAASAVLLAGCAGAGRAAEDGRIAVVASTNVYGQIVEEIGGDLVAVTSIVSAAAQDPHSFEPSARDQLAVARAALVVRNGGGYDAFVDVLLAASGSVAPVVTAVELAPDGTAGGGHGLFGDEAGATDASAAAPADHAAAASGGRGGHGAHDHTEGGDVHVWYDPGTMSDVAAAVAAALSELSPVNARAFAANAETFIRGAAGIEARIADLAGRSGGARIFATEPAPLPLTEAAGLVDVAPPAFTEAVEEGRDVPAAALLAALALLRPGDVRLVVANAQTGGAEAAAVQAAAVSASIPVVPLTETLPRGRTYLSWMRANVDALAEVLAP